MKNNLFKASILFLVIFSFVIVFSGAVAAACDVTVSSISASDHTSPGKEITINYKIKNQGSTDTNNGFYTSFYLASTKSSSTKKYLGSQYTSPLSSNSYRTKQAVFKVPNVTYNTYYVLAKVDSTYKVPESIENNNIRYTTSKTRIYQLIDYGVTETKGYLVKIDDYGYYSTGVADQAVDGMLYPTNYYWKTYKYKGIILIYTSFYHTTLERTIKQTIKIDYYKFPNVNGISLCLAPKSWGGSSKCIVSGLYPTPSQYYWNYFRKGMIALAPAMEG